VTSKWWTTEAALQVMKDWWLETIVKNWIKSAYSRAKEIG
jgi:pyrroline-5-carboxylate reductase